jgi:hypothetical protein
MQRSLHKRGFRQRFIALLACASMVLSAIAPTISHALAIQTTPTGMMKVCTSAGNKFMPVSFIIAKANVNFVEQTPATSPRANKTDKMSACSNCDQHAGSIVVLQHADHLFLDASNAVKLNTAFYINPRTYFLSTPTSPRGPPLATF